MGLHGSTKPQSNTERANLPLNSDRHARSFFTSHIPNFFQHSISRLDLLLEDLSKPIILLSLHHLGGYLYEATVPLKIVR